MQIVGAIKGRTSKRNAIFAGLGLVAATAAFRVETEGEEFECESADQFVIARAKHRLITGALTGYVGTDYNGLRVTIDSHNSSKFDCVEARIAEAARNEAEQKLKEGCAIERKENSKLPNWACLKTSS